MKTAIITGSNGLVGGQAVSYFSSKADNIIGIDNNMREYFFGNEADTTWNKIRLEMQFKNYRSYDLNIVEYESIERVFKKYNESIDLIIHAAAQPSHDWAAKEPITDFNINAKGTLNLLELMRLHCPNAVFIFTSTNKVYGDKPNDLPYVELETRWELDKGHKYYMNGIDERMSIDNSLHSIFGASKIAADIMVQEYGKYFGLNTGVFRGGCLTGPNHSGSELHGFLSYLMKCCIEDRSYNIYGYNGKQVRDNIHSYDLIKMFWSFFQNPKCGEVYNVGGSRFSNCSVIEAINKINVITGNKLDYHYINKQRIGDHKWWISDVSKFKRHYPLWDWHYDLDKILKDMYVEMTEHRKEI